jgi:Zn-dependent M28 family amino/carboxypeptidase
MPDLTPGYNAIHADDLLAHMKVLASDEFQGRKPGTIGEEKTVEYLRKQCLSIGLEPAVHDGFVQQVPVTGFRSSPNLKFVEPGKTIEPKFLDDYVAASRKQDADLKIDNSDVVFVGYGIVAPEYGWDDYKDVDVRGKTILMLIGDPQRPDPAHPEQLDETFFRGRALTYYGRWTYKFEIASERGAKAALIIHEKDAAGYGFDVVRASWGGENFELGVKRDKYRVEVEGWVSNDLANDLFHSSGMNYADLKNAASKADFRPQTLKAKAFFNIKNVRHSFNSLNFIAKLSGSDPKLKDECIVYCAHWDHFGTEEKDGKHGVFSGALDNASGMAFVLEIAKAFASLPQRPKRSILFFFPTLEEHGLLGAEYYVLHPQVPLKDTIAIINFDVMNMWGKTREIVSIAKGHSTLDAVLDAETAKQGRRVVSDPEPEKGYFFRSDHLEFLRAGIPALFFLHPGSDYIGQAPDYGSKKKQQYVSNDYHKITDKVKSNWDLSGAEEDCKLLFACGWDIADAPTRPAWSPSSEFQKK